MKIEIKGESLELLPEKAFYWEKEQILGLSDVHLGKAEALQRFGIPLPSKTNLEDLNRIQNLVQKWKPKQVLILGDFIHNWESWTEDLLDTLKDFFLKVSGIKWSLILGNHEKGSLPYLQKLPLEIISEGYKRDPFVFTHGHLEQETQLFKVEGHLHPVLTLSDGPLRIRFPCFVLNPDHLLLPSFGVLTGGIEITPTRNQRRFAVTPKEVFEVARAPQKA